MNPLTISNKGITSKQKTINTPKVNIILIISIICLVLSALLSLAFGSRSVGFEDIIKALTRNDTQSLESIVILERIPRTIFSLIAGAALGVAGTLMQAITRNPIADPSILGVNTGASLFVVCGIAFFRISSSNEYILLALLGSAITAVFVYSIGSMGRGGATPIKLALAGAATSAALSSLVSTILLPRVSAMDDFRFWQVGSVGGATWEGILAVTPFLMVGLIIGILSASALNILALGDDVAAGLGVNTSILRLVTAFAGVLLCGATTAIAGPIGFIGLIAPHIMRLLLGPDKRLIIPMSAVSGAVILTISDVIGRLIGGTGEVEVGIITAFLGAPIMIIIAVKSKVRGL